jgi:hypothetical protein
MGITPMVRMTITLGVGREVLMMTRKMVRMRMKARMATRVMIHRVLATMTMMVAPMTGMNSIPWCNHRLMIQTCKS